MTATTFPGGPTPVAMTVREAQDLAHLMRRTGFGASREELSTAVSRGYEATVDALLHPQPDDPGERLLVDRYFPASTAAHEWAMAWPHWAWPLLTSRHPLREKLALFWHGLFATGFKVGLTGVDQIAQIEMFRAHGLGRFEDLLLRVAQDPAMLTWLDNVSNTNTAPNENFGRELLELFSMGVGSYSEDDVRAAARALTGWSVRPAPSAFLLGPHPMQFAYRAVDHDAGSKRFLDADGALNGQDVVATIARHPATARFICARLYRFFVADEEDDAAIEELCAAFRASGGEIRAVLRPMFLAPWFRAPAVRQAKVKIPVELVFGLARLTGTWELPDHRLLDLVAASSLMGQTPLNPPNVGGWPQGRAWLHGSCVLERINFASAMVGDTAAGGVRAMLDGIEAGGPDTPEALLDACLEALGSIELSQESRAVLLAHAGEQHDESLREHAVRLLKLIVATPDYQYC